MDEDIESCEEGKRSLLSISLDYNHENYDAKNSVNKNFKYNHQRRPHSLSISWNSQSSDKTEAMSPALSRWFKAVSKICKHDDDIDPWHDFLIDSIKSEKAIRYRYSAIKKKWVQDEIWIKLETLPFDHGAMRECFRLKKLSTTGVYNNDWSFSSNYVAKQYINVVGRDVYFEDVKLQMESKLWAEEYNRQNPPKKIDIFQLSIIELIERDNKPLYHIEHFMEGTYLKYNSNSGYVDDSCLRNTPQAFSHFTFERSGHRIIIVDIQGVGDLYTDPQIHTADGLNYGDGNLGLRGMALFFSSHRCNMICHFLGLSEFDMHCNELVDNDLDQEIDNDISAISIDAPPEDDSCAFSFKSYNELKKRNRSISFKMSGTVVKDGRMSPCIASPAFLDNLFPAPVDLIRAMSVDSGVQSVSTPFVSQGNFMTPSIADSEDSLSSVISGGNFLQMGIGSFPQPCEIKTNLSSALNSRKVFRRRQRNYSDGSDVDASLVSYEEHLAAHHSMRENHKPSSATHPTNLDQEIGHSILAQVHHELARLHESGRFLKSKQLAAGLLHHQFWSHLLNEKDSPDDVVPDSATNHDMYINWEACLFHERHAAQLGCLEAVIVMARYCLNMSGHMLQDCPLPPTQNDRDCGLDYLWRAADSGDRRSMIELANLHRKIDNVELKPSDLEPNKTTLTVDWYEAVKWYKRAFEAANKPEGQLDSKDAEGRYDSADDLMPPQEILASMAELYFKGGYGLERNCQLAGELYSQAAEIATNALQGRQAVKYYELADIAFSQEECE